MFPLPEAAQILGTLRRALNLRHPDEGARHYVQGHRRLKDETRAEVFEDMVRAFVDAGYVSAPADNLEGIVKLISDGLAHAIARWDHLVGHAPTISAGADPNATATRYLRLAAIDVAIRAAAFSVLFDIPTPPSGLGDHARPVAAWAHEGALKRVLRDLPSALRTTRAKLSSGKKFDELFDGRSRPSLPKLGEFAELVAAHDASNTPAFRWRLYLVWMFALDALCSAIAETVGRPAVEDIAVACCRVRSTARQLLSDLVRNTDDRDLVRGFLADLVVDGARAANAGPLIDRLATTEAQIAGLMALAPDAKQQLNMLVARQPEQLLKVLADVVAATDLAPLSLEWAFDVRVCRADWILSEFSALMSREPIAPNGIPIEVGKRLVCAMANLQARPHELVDACFAHPEALLWAVRTLVQRAFVSGQFHIVLPMLKKLAGAVPSPRLCFETAIIHAAAGEIDDALRYLDATGAVEPFATAAKPLRVVANALTGRHAVALAQIDAIENRDRVLEYARGVALRGDGQIREALRTFELILADAPGHALALEQAAQCCYELASTETGKRASAWTTKGNRYAKLAQRRGRPISPGRKRSQ